jgi:hypothetical protein
MGGKGGEEGRGVGEREGRSGKGGPLNHSLPFKVKLLIKTVMGGAELEGVPKEASKFGPFLGGLRASGPEKAASLEQWLRRSKIGASG